MIRSYVEFIINERRSRPLSTNEIITILDNGIKKYIINQELWKNIIKTNTLPYKN